MMIEKSLTNYLSEMVVTANVTMRHAPEMRPVIFLMVIATLANAAKKIPH